MVSVKLKDINKKFSNTVVLNNMNLNVEDKEFFILLGASGSGKSTTLNIIAGLERATSGDILFDDKIVNSMSPVQRGIAMVFQDYALYPHLTVRNNIAFPLKMRKYTKDVIDEKVEEVAKTLGLEEYLNRYPRELSGGQAQRVSLGRALVRDPGVFLLDEPLSNLDAKIRNQIRVELKLIQQNLGKTFIYVTHDQQEAMSLGDHIAILRNGKLEQVGAPMEVYKNPRNEYVAAFLGEPVINFFEMVKDSGVYVSDDLIIKGINAEEKEINIGIRPESMKLKREKENDIELKIRPQTIESFGSYSVIIGKSKSNKEVRVRLSEDFDLNSKSEMALYISISDLYIFGKNGNRIDKN
ncbi:ABC transporter ATP-binding protein [Cuniculiplasma divulgatum]|jgi:ABC-type sugar transport system ATPase subunit|uniref:CUT1 family ABC transporter ATPase n=1 Tax=Cuniculiplasma divulgatum TaxID=1673428 RepID=A0A1N5W835_9ARCH|nr:ABC transporter ATP-binding protein [Cuniculiplasma divulgatum]MCI2413013.1 ABC transporter ATP-binding protein [Cuniculiplasma sp.]WMT49782.1 MAG: ABC transporter ATP-binding protein [Thermoplasmatales archaeon]SIM80477.1 CUT1 family ABC transporter ATPase [Cuniculiplasma divulgatum]